LHFLAVAQPEALAPRKKLVKIFTDALGIISIFNC